MAVGNVTNMHPTVHTVSDSASGSSAQTDISTVTSKSEIKIISKCEAITQ